MRLFTTGYLHCGSVEKDFRYYYGTAHSVQMNNAYFLTAVNLLL